MWLPFMARSEASETASLRGSTGALLDLIHMSAARESGTDIRGRSVDLRLSSLLV